MIAPGAGVRVYLACGVTDMRRGITGLAACAQQVLNQNPACGAVFCFRGRRGDRLKLLFWDGQGFCLYYKVLEKGRFPWPSPADGTALRLTPGQDCQEFCVRGHSDGMERSITWRSRGTYWTSFWLAAIRRICSRRTVLSMS